MTSPQASVEEGRFDAPRRRAVSDFKRLDTGKPVSTQKLAEAFNDLHDCVHRGQVRSARRMVWLAKSFGKHMPSDEELEAGIDPPPPKKTFGDFKPWKALLYLTAIQLAYQIGWPTVQALHHALLTAGK